MAAMFIAPFYNNNGWALELILQEGPMRYTTLFVTLDKCSCNNEVSSKPSMEEKTKKQIGFLSYHACKAKQGKFSPSNLNLEHV